MLKHSIIVFALLLLTICPTQAKPVDEAQALQLATRFRQGRSETGLRSAPTLKLVWKASSSHLRSAADPAFYIFNIGDDQGFVIVSGEDATKTILAYADEGSFQTENMPDNLKNWLQFYQQEIEAVRVAASSVETTTEVSTVAAGTTSVAPLLGNVKWNQSNPYNLFCPLDATSGSRTLAGCVAVAMSQIMKYYRWPVTGKGTHSYTDAKYGLQSVDFSMTNYDWDNMLGYYGSGTTPEQDNAVATLVYHLGVAVDMAYSTTGSSSTISKAAEAFVSHFGYDSEIQRYERAYYSASEWNALLKKELDNARPVYYSANSDAGGHAFVCDGYDSNDLFHINWGWGGSSNGYFELSSLSSTNPGVVGAAPEYSYYQSVLANIRPADALNKTSNQVMLYKYGLASSTSSVNSINTSSFSVTYSFGNMGTNPVSVRWGVGYVKEGSSTLTKLVDNSTQYTTISSGSYYSTPRTFSISKPTALSTKGVYRLYPIYLPKDSTTWSIMRGTSELNNCLVVTVANTNGSTTILPEKYSPSLVLDTLVQPLSRLYQDKSLNVELTIRNTGKEYYSTVGICLINVTDPGDRTYICESKVLCPSGETKTFHFTGTVGCPPGFYYLQAQFDSTNTNSTMNYKAFGPNSFNDQPVEVLPPPGPPVLQLNKLLTLNNGIVYSKTDTMYLSASITNSGGYFDSRIIAFVFPKAGGRSINILNPKYVCIDSLQSAEVTLSGAPGLEPGEYSFSIYSYGNNTWNLMTPGSMATIYFTVTDGSSALKTTNSPLYVRQEANRLVLESEAEPQASSLFDLYGRRVRSATSERILSTEGLPPGLYLLQVRIQGKTYHERILRH